MKKILTFSALAGLLGVISVSAAVKDIYITGSTAFRSQAYTAIKTGLYNSTGFSEFPSPGAGGNSVWTMSGTMSLFPGDTVVVHANFTGSVQGIYSLYNNSDTKVYYADTSGNLITNTATCAFSDVDSIATSYPLDSASFIELHVAIQPFCWVRNAATPTTITNVTIQQLQEFMPAGRIALSYFTGNPSDHSKKVWLVNRSLDSGTRVTAYADAYVSGSPTVWYWNTNPTMYGTNQSGGPNINVFVVATNYLGPSLFSYGYVGGGDVVAAINAASTNALAYLGLADAKNVNGGLDIMTYNGFTPSSDIKTGVAVPTTPSFDNVINGQYSYWAYECLDYPRTISYGGQDISGADIDTFCRALGGYDNLYNFVPGATGSIDNVLSTASPKVAIRLGDMNVGRAAVGGPIAP
jgi:hypothetical protein